MGHNVDNFNEREREIFLEALEKATAEERARFVEEACAGDTALRAAVEALLSNRENRLLDEVAEAARPALLIPALEKVGDCIGRYKLLEKIGEGGFGVVYLAEQTEPVKRSVALKVIKLGMDTAQVVARFEAERQALAIMDHPNIAKVLDGGATEKGRPYFVMEWVRGEPVTLYCSENRLSTEERLQLFVQVCQAVQHAHQKGIIHRDLKPSNILVTVHDGQAVPKIIDFGIAKATQQGLTDKTIFTQFHHFLGTPAYVSPEQAQVTSVDIDTRTDIYSLGVLLYELLTGETPFDAKELLASGLDEMRRTIREKEPVRPSTKLKLSRATTRSPDAVETHRQLQCHVNPDLDCIVMKCLEKERDRRYATASGLAADLRRYLNCEPVAARPPSNTDRLRKFVVRHRVASVAGALTLLAVASGALISTWALVHERAASRRADQRLQAALGFVDEIFNRAAPKIADMAGAAAFNETLAQSGLNFVQNLRKSAGDDPATRVALARLLVRVGLNQNPGGGNTLGNYEAGLRRADEAIELLKIPTPQLTEGARLNLLCDAQFAGVQCLYGLGRWNDGAARSEDLERLLERLAQAPEFSARGHRQLASVRGNVAYSMILAGRAEEAIQVLRRAQKTTWISALTDASPPYDLELLANLNDNLAAAYQALHRPESMLAPAREALRIWHIIVSRLPTHAVFAAALQPTLCRLGHAQLLTGRVADGLALLGQARAESEKLVQKERENAPFLQTRAAVTAMQAWALAEWSEEPAASLTERQERLAQSAVSLGEAEEFCRTAKLKEADYYLEAARAAAASAKAKLGVIGQRKEDTLIRSTE